MERDVIEPILDVVGDRDWDVCITHGENGEYGHRRHMDVHNAVLQIVRHNRLFCRRLWTFAYAATANKDMYVVEDAEVVVTLNEKEFSRKRELIRDVYGFPETGFEFGACLQEEGFKIAFEAGTTKTVEKKRN